MPSQVRAWGFQSPLRHAETLGHTGFTTLVGVGCVPIAYQLPPKEAGDGLRGFLVHHWGYVGVGAERDGDV